MRLTPWFGIFGIAFSLAGGLGAQEVKERSSIPVNHTWDLTAMYPSDQAWETDFTALEKAIPHLKTFEGKVSKSGASLLAYFKAMEEASKKAENLAVYAGMANDQDTRNATYIAFRDRIQSLGARFSEAISWFEPELVSIPPATFERWYKATPGLAIYRHSIDNALRTKAHTLSPKEERLLAMASTMSSTASKASGALRNSDMTFPMIKDEHGKDVQLSEGRRLALLESSDPRVRRETDMALLSTYGTYKNTFAQLMGGQVERDMFYAKARNYPSTLHASLDGDNIDPAVYTQLLETVRKRASVLQRYVDLRRRALKLEQIHLYDLSVPLLPETRQTVDYQAAVATIQKAMAPMGSDYLKAMNEGFSKRWIDVYETKGKRSGAYSWGSYLSHPYILLNYNDTLDDMFTVAHELGHSMHSWLSRQGQPYIYADYSLFNAEVASTFNEALLMDHLLKEEKDPAKRLYLVNQYIDNIRGTVITQVMFADFEYKMHQAAEAGEALTAEKLGQLYLETLKAYYGTSVAYDPEYAHTWSRIPHFYRNFYVYKYATSFCASQLLSQRVLKGEKGAKEAYFGYLSGGSSKYPLELLKDAGVDMTQSAPVEATMGKLDELIDEMERLLKATGKL